MDNPTYITQEGLDKLKGEYKTLKEKTIPEIADRIDVAKQLGDLSENAEYHAAKEDMSWAQTRALELEEKLRDTEVIQQSTRTDRIEIGSTFVVEINDTQKTFTIVGAPEADPKEGKISNESPLGQALIGKRVGDEIEIEVLDGVRRYEILRIQ